MSLSTLCLRVTRAVAVPFRSLRSKALSDNAIVTSRRVAYHQTHDLFGQIKNLEYLYVKTLKYLRNQLRTKLFYKWNETDQNIYFCLLEWRLI